MMEFLKSQPLVASCMIGVFIAGILGYLFFVRGDLESLHDLHVQEEHLKLDQSSNPQQVLLLNKIKTEVELLEHDFAAILRYLPEESEMPLVLDELSQLGTTSGLVCTLFAPQTQEAHDFYIVVPIKMTLVGDYAQHLLFLKRMTELKRLMIVQELNLSESTHSNLFLNQDDLSKEHLVMHLTVGVYSYGSHFH